MKVVLFDVGLVDGVKAEGGTQATLWRTQSFPLSGIFLWSDEVKGQLVSDGDQLLLRLNRHSLW